MRHRLRRRPNILTPNSAHQQRIRHQRAMTPPRHRLRAHQYNPIALRRPNQRLHRLPELRRLHIIRIPAKRQIPPSRIRRTRARPPQPAQRRPVFISNPRRLQRRRQPLPPELRIRPRPRHRANVDQPRHAMPAQHLQKLFQRPIRMPDRQNQPLRRHRRSRFLRRPCPPLPRSSHRLGFFSFHVKSRDAAPTALYYRNTI